MKTDSSTVDATPEAGTDETISMKIFGVPDARATAVNEIMQKVMEDESDDEGKGSWISLKESLCTNVTDPAEQLYAMFQFGRMFAHHNDMPDPMEALMSMMGNGQDGGILLGGDDE